MKLKLLTLSNLPPLQKALPRNIVKMHPCLCSPCPYVCDTAIWPGCLQRGQSLDSKAAISSLSRYQKDGLAEKYFLKHWHSTGLRLMTIWAKKNPQERTMVEQKAGHRHRDNRLKEGASDTAGTNDGQ